MTVIVFRPPKPDTPWLVVIDGKAMRNGRFWLKQLIRHPVDLSNRNLFYKQIKLISLDKMADTFADDIFKRIVLNKNVRISIQMSLKFVPWGSNTNKSSLLQVMAWRPSVLVKRLYKLFNCSSTIWLTQWKHFRMQLIEEKVYLTLQFYWKSLSTKWQ